MAVSDNNTPAGEAEAQSETVAPERPYVPGLYDHQLKRYSAALAEDLIAALDRYGFSMFHSLTPEERAVRELEMGIEPTDGVGQCNLALALASQERYEEAIAWWKKALKTAPSLIVAECNIALAYEQLGNSAQSRKHFKAYLEAVSDPEARREVEEHLSALKE